MRVGQIIKGAKGHYELIKQLRTGAQAPTTFKARILPGSDISPLAEWALIKAPSPWQEGNLKSLKQNYTAYQNYSIRVSPYFRAMYEITENSTNPPYLVFEWMDHTLQDIVSESHRKNTVLHHAILKACLMGLVELETQRLVHLNITPGTILLSRIDTDRPIVKLGNLSQTCPDGYDSVAQPLALRPPELFRDISWSHRSNVWSLVASLLSWIKPGVFEIRSNPFITDDLVLCIAMLMRLFPNWANTLDDHNSNLAGARCIIEDFERAEKNQSSQLNKSDEDHKGHGRDEDNEHDEGHEDEECSQCEVCCSCRQCRQYREEQLKVSLVSSLEDEMKKMDLQPVLVNLFRYLLVTDPKKRPSAKDALASKQFRALEEAAFARWQK